jgi:hypothetical protein
MADSEGWDAAEGKVVVTWDTSYKERRILYDAPGAVG